MTSRYDLLAAARQGRATYDWFDVVSEAHGYTLTLRMTSDAVRVDGVRGTVTAQEAQLVADELGAILPTAKLLDLRWDQAKRKTLPHPQPIASDDAAVLRHSRAIDAEAAGLGHGAIANVGKPWILDERMTPQRAVLYSWHLPQLVPWRGIKLHPSVSLPGVGVIQPVSTAHDYYHHDYSSTLVLCHPSAMLSYEGQQAQRVLLADVLSTPVLCELVLHTPRPIKARYPIG